MPPSVSSLCLDLVLYAIMFLKDLRNLDWTCMVRTHVFTLAEFVLVLAAAFNKAEKAAAAEL